MTPQTLRGLRWLRKFVLHSINTVNEHGYLEIAQHDRVLASRTAEELSSMIARCVPGGVVAVINDSSHDGAVTLAYRDPEFEENFKTLYTMLRALDWARVVDAPDADILNAKQITFTFVGKPDDFERAKEMIKAPHNRHLLIQKEDLE